MLGIRQTRQAAGGLWTPAQLASGKQGVWLDYTDGSTLTLSGSAITAVADKWGRTSLSAFPVGLSSTQRRVAGSGALSGWNVARGSIDSGGTLGSRTNSVGFAGSISGLALASATVITQISLVYGEDSFVNNGLLGVRPQNLEGAGWGPPYADFFSRQGNAWLTGAGGGLVNVSTPQTTWYLYAHQFGVTSGLNEVILDEGNRTGASASGTIGTSGRAVVRALGGELGSGGNTDGWMGQCAEQVVMVGATNADRQRVAGYLAWKYGLQASVLPSGHPFRFSPP
jgi:hypothetical protein